ncbi:hypothetical protein IQ64_00175 [Streptomyces stelliscabiei]|nr:hypothetical protein IQ64_00175 [Streptomyces stelliscabiei]
MLAAGVALGTGILADPAGAWAAPAPRLFAGDVDAGRRLFAAGAYTRLDQVLPLLLAGAAHSIEQGPAGAARTAGVWVLASQLAVKAPSVPLPLDLKPLVAAIDSADPAQAALAALFAFHALSPAQARSLPLTAFSNGRLHLDDGRVILLAQEARERFQAYVDDRARRWPDTTNPHLFITQFTARRTTPVTSQWMNSKLGLPAQAIREDRILDEAQAAGDPRRLCDLFGLSVGGTLRYTATLNHPDLDEISTRTTRPRP